MMVNSVSRYNTKSGQLTLQHNYPAGTSATVLVDVNLLLETLTSTDTQIGEWVNVMGYVTAAEQKGQGQAIQAYVSCIQAILLWSAGAIKIDNYEKFLTEQTKLL